MQNSQFRCWSDTYTFGSKKLDLQFCQYQDFEIGPDVFHKHNIHFPQHIAKSVNKRRLEYFAGRLCASSALRSLGINTQISTGSKREPQWPNDIIGSISHSHNMAVSAVEMNTGNNSLGIDLEGLIEQELLDEIVSQIMTPDEISLAGSNLSTVDFTRVFSAKESFFKAAFHFVGDYFGFEALLLTGIHKNKLDFKIAETLSPSLLAGAGVQVHTLYLSDNLLLSVCILDGCV